MITELIEMAINSSPSLTMTFPEIVTYITEHFPVYARSSDWSSSDLEEIIQKYLLHNFHFVKSPQELDGYNFWKIASNRNAINEAKQSQGLLEKPPYSYVVLIQMALKNSLGKMMTESAIFKFLQKNFPYFRKCPFNWRELVQQTLTEHVCFTKLPPVMAEKCIFDYWTITSADRMISISLNSERKQSQSFSDIPPYHYTELIQMAIMSSPHQIMTSQQVIEFLFDNFLYFARCKSYWPKCVRATLRHHNIFVKLPLKWTDDVHCWTVHPYMCTISEEMFDSVNLPRPSIWKKIKRENLSGKKDPTNVDISSQASLTIPQATATACFTRFPTTTTSTSTATSIPVSPHFTGLWETQVNQDRPTQPYHTLIQSSELPDCNEESRHDTISLSVD